LAKAKEEYGVVIDEKEMKVDTEATRKARDTMRVTT